MQARDSLACYEQLIPELVDHEIERIEAIVRQENHYTPYHHFHAKTRDYVPNLGTYTHSRYTSIQCLLVHKNNFGAHPH